jgi:alpha-glucosidase (family GH31 glycosyl hydrolase)
MSEPITIALKTGATLRIQPISHHAFSIRLNATGIFDASPMVCYGILNSTWPDIQTHTTETARQIIIRTDRVSLVINKKDGRLTFLHNGKKILTQTEAPVCDPERGFRAAFTLKDNEKLYGLGDETRDTIQKRGRLARMWVKNVACYVPIPILISTGGWAILLNTTQKHYFDLGHSQTNQMAFGANAGELDYYLIAGEDLPTLLNRYTDIAGKPHLLPLWGYGLTFVCNQQANAREMLDDCLNLRRENIPCDLVGLEPGWMSKRYDYSIEKDWHTERFFIPPWSKKGPHTFLAAAERLGFKMSLWLCCDYDLSFEEERQAGTTVQKRSRNESVHPDDFEQDQNFGHGPIYQDKLTKPDEPWFEHLKKFVDQGVCAFKMDGALQVNEHPDRRYGNGMTDADMHNLYPTLLNKQMSLGFKEHTGRRAMIYSSGGYLGIQRYAATWAGDTGGGPKPLVSILNHGLSGHANASCDMDVFTPAGIHFGFFMPWSQVCSWAYWRHPWLLGEHLGNIFKYYARLRYRLLPYIYSMAHIAARTGYPIMRAMPLVFPNDPQADYLMHQYMFGDAFLTGAFIDHIHLPQGRWIDYWTGEVHTGPKDMTCNIPADRGGSLFVRAGAIIPHWPDMQYVGQKPVDTLDLHVYPHGDSSFTLYEDDGISYAYQEGAVTTTEIGCSAANDVISLVIGARSGHYNGMPETRSFNVYMHLDREPSEISLDDHPLAGEDWFYDETTHAVRLHVTEAPFRSRVIAIFF